MPRSVRSLIAAFVFAVLIMMVLAIIMFLVRACMNG